MKATGWAEAAVGGSGGGWTGALPAATLGARAVSDAFVAHEGRLVATALGMVRDPEAARDVVQSALERALRGVDSFRGEARMSTWLHRIVVNQALMWLRARRRRTRHETPLEDEHERCVAGPAADVDAALDVVRDGRRLHAALAQLAPREREVLVQCIAHEVDYATLAARNGEHALAVKTRTYRARHRLASLMAPETVRTGASAKTSGAPLRAASASAEGRARVRPR